MGIEGKGRKEVKIKDWIEIEGELFEEALIVIELVPGEEVELKELRLLFLGLVKNRL
jgi:hypothetical protein